MTRRCLIADDEAEARRRLRRLLAVHADRAGIVSEASDGLAAVRRIEEDRPDLAFMDIQMPGLDGFQVLDSLPRELWPVVVFTTAYDQYAIRAFEVHALDYLLKPVTESRLAECLTRIESLEGDLLRGRLIRAQREGRRLERLMARSGTHLTVVRVEDVIVFESEDKLVFARTQDGRFNINITMKELQDRLDPDLFCRVHRQAIVQLHHARELHSLPGGQYLIRLSDGSDVQMGRNYSRNFRSRFG